MGRKYTSKDDADRYMDPDTAELRKLVVAASNDIYKHDAPGVNSWKRTHIRNVGPLMLRIAYWPWKDVEDDSGAAIHSADDIWLVALKWIPTVIGLFLALPLPQRSAALKDGWNYAPFPYQYWGYPKVFRNIRENRQDFSGGKQLTDIVLSADAVNPHPTQERLLRPSQLCYLREGGKGICTAVGSSDPFRGGAPSTAYVFLAFSTKHFDERNKSDMEALQDIGEVAARRAGVKAFWCSAMCMLTREVLEQDMYRMSDIIRGAESLAIALKPSHDPEHWRDANSRNLLVQFSARMWTFPEVLLSPQHKDITVYSKRSADVSDEKPESQLLDVEIIPKRDFARRAWSDAPEARQLLDHYMGSQILSRLELTVIAFRCLHRRRVKEHFAGDLAYALMGLLRRRPEIDSSDSEFQATARLSLVNDTDSLFERLICTLPRVQGGHWLTSDDAWGAVPWDIQPRCQIAGICENDTVILDGCRAAAIQWEGFKRVVHARRINSWKRKFARFLFRLSPISIVILGAIVSYTSPSLQAPTSSRNGRPDYLSYYRSAAMHGTSSTAAACIFLLVVNVIVILASPYLVKIVYGGKIWRCEARLFGFEGYMDIRTMEAHIFGHAFGRLQWSAAGSRFSRHSTNKYGERVGRDPTDDPHMRDIVAQARNSPFGAQKVFTIVDTLSLVSPPLIPKHPPSNWNANSQVTDRAHDHRRASTSDGAGRRQRGRHAPRGAVLVRLQDADALPRVGHTHGDAQHRSNASHFARQVRLRPAGPGLGRGSHARAGDSGEDGR